MNGAMKNPARGLGLWASMLVVALSGCGGGGGDSAAPPATPATPASTPTTPGNYVGAYRCTNDNNDAVLWDVTMATASGAFATCRGVTESGFGLTCTGSISAQGTFVLDGQDPRSYVTTMRGTVAGDRATGNYSVTGVGLSGTFTCLHQ